MRLVTTHEKSVTHANLGKLKKPGGGRGGVGGLSITWEAPLGNLGGTFV